MTSKIIAVLAAAVGVSLAAPACAEAAASTEASGHSQPGVSLAGTRQLALPGGTAAADGRRTPGSGCSILPRTGPSSRAGLAAAPAATALSRTPALSELVHAIQRAGLTTMLNSARALTVFAPDNAAFYALGAGNLQALLTTRPDLVRVLEFYLVAGRVAPAELGKRHVFTSVAGTRLYLARYGKRLAVNNATVTCGNVQTSNATVYVVDRLIVPGS